MGIGFKIKKIPQKKLEKDLLFAVSQSLRSMQVSYMTDFLIREVRYDEASSVFVIVLVCKGSKNLQQKNGICLQMEKTFSINGINIPYFVIWENCND